LAASNDFCQELGIRRFGGIDGRIINAKSNDISAPEPHFQIGALFKLYA
jgi:hypothetical protein